MLLVITNTTSYCPTLVMTNPTVSSPLASMNMASTAGIIGAVVGMAVLVGIIICCCCYCRRRREKAEEYPMEYVRNTSLTSVTHRGHPLSFIPVFAGLLKMKNSQTKTLKGERTTVTYT